MNMTFSRMWTARFSDCDPFGIAHYPRIVEAIHDTSAIFMESVGWPYHSMSRKHGFGFPIVAVELEFEKPIRAGDQVEITLTYELGNSSLRFDYTGRIDGSVAFEGYEQRVCVEVDGDEGIAIPDELRQALSAN